MPTIDQYVADAYLRLLLQGSPGSGKTTLACQFPSPWVMDCDINLAGPLRWLREHNRALPLGYDLIDRKDDGTIVGENLRYTRLTECLARAIANPDVKTIVIDSMTKVADYVKAHTLWKNPTKTGQMEMTSWGFFYNYWVNLIATITANRKHFVLIAHEKVDKDETDGALKYFINVQGQFRDIAGALFTDVWRAEVQGGTGLAPVHKWLIRTTPDYRFALKNSFSLPPLFEFDWKIIQEKIDKK